MSVSFIAATGSSGAGASIAYPSNLENDVLVYTGGFYDDAGVTVAPPANWNLIDSQVVAWPLSGKSFAFWRLVPAGGLAGSTDFVPTPGVYSSNLMICFRGADPANPIGATNLSAGTGASVSVSGVTVGRDGSMLALGLLGYDGIFESNLFAGMTRASTSDESASYYQAVNAGATGAKTGTTAFGGSGWGGHLIVVQPAADAAGPGTSTRLTSGFIMGSGSRLCA